MRILAGTDGRIAAARLFSAAGLAFGLFSLGPVAEAEAGALDVAAQQGALRRAAAAGPLKTYDAHGFYHPYLYHPYPVEWVSPAPIYFKPQIKVVLVHAHPYRKPPQLTCFRPSLIVIGRKETKPALPRVTYGAPLPCGYRG